MKALIHFYEDSYQFNSKSVEFVSYDIESLFDHISQTLNGVYAYTGTEKELWATVWIDGGLAYHVSRVSDTEVEVWDWDMDLASRFSYEPRVLA